MGWASLLADSAKNPFTSFLGDNANALRGLGVGLARGTDINTGLANAARYAAEGAEKDDAFAVTRKAEADRQEQLSKTMEFLRTSAPQYAAAVEAGVLSPAEAYGMHLKGMEAPEPRPMDIREVNGDLLGIDTIGGGVRTLYDGAAPTPEAPSGFQPDPANPAALTFIPGGPQDPAVKELNKPPTEAQQRAASLVHVVTPELETIEKNWGELDNWENQVMGAEVPFTGWKPMQGLTSDENQQAQNSLKTIVASYLYAISGATANPGEVANQIEILTPRMGEDPKSVKAKKDRVRKMVEAIQIQAKGGIPKPVDGASTEPGAVLTYNPETGELE